MTTNTIRVATYARKVFMDNTAGTKVTRQVATCRELFLSRRVKRISSADEYLRSFKNFPFVELRSYGELRLHLEAFGRDELLDYSMDCISTDMHELLWSEQFPAKLNVLPKIASEHMR